MPKIPLMVIGVLAAIIAAFLTISHIANITFNQKAKKEVGDFFTGIEDKGEIIQESDLAELPPSVQKWLVYSQVIGKERITTARLKQTAVMRLKKEGRWMPLEAEQYFTVDKPGYIWIAKVKAAPLMHIGARDKYHAGKGNVLIKFLSLATVANSKGEETDQGSLVRYLAETMWIPTAALSNHITWEEIDGRSARATMSYAGITASGVFHFNEKGQVINFIAPRYGEFDGKFALETWSIPVKEYGEFDGIRVPTRGDVIWKLKTGDFNWYKFEVKKIEYNKPFAYTGDDSLFYLSFFHSFWT
ncbi:MAG: hypothetical protein MJA84_02720 [Firmicutes bacterium]|nr:hypothetical protein [Bacillota bacterium]